MATEIELTWEQFQELRALLEAIRQAKAHGADEGEIKNTFVDGEWKTDAVEITLDL